MASKTQNKIKAEMQKKGYKVVSVIRLSENGYPDLLCMKNGEIVWIESKESYDKLSPLQKVRIKELRANGFTAYCYKDTKGIIY